MILPGGLRTCRRALHRLGGAEHADRERSQLHPGDGVASPSRAPRGDLLEHLDLGEAHRVDGSSALGDDVRDGEAGNDDQQPEPAQARGNPNSSMDHRRTQPPPTNVGGDLGQPVAVGRQLQPVAARCTHGLLALVPAARRRGRRSGAARRP